MSPIRFFISYAHDDRAFLSELISHLWSFDPERRGKIELFYDRGVKAGRAWSGVIDSRLDRADVVVLLLSARFVASRHAVREAERALVRKRQEGGRLIVVPVLLAPYMDRFASYRHLQRLPRGDKAVVQYVNRDEAWKDVVEGICECLFGEDGTITDSATWVPRDTDTPSSPRTIPEDPRPVDDVAPDVPLEFYTVTGAGGVGASPVDATESGDSVTRIPSSFDNVRYLCSGGFADLFLANQRSTGRDVCLKVLSKRSRSALRKTLFAKEIDILGLLPLPGVPALFTAGVTNDHLLFYAMEELRGWTVRDVLSTSQRLSLDPPAQRLSLEQSVSIVRRISETIALLHRIGHVHLDIKPENVFLCCERPTEYSERTRVVVLDFGLSGLSQPNLRVRGEPGKGLGTPRYMAPEQKNHVYSDPRSDIYSAAMVLEELIEAGELGLAGAPSRLLDLLRRATCSDPDGRPRSAAAFAAELDASAGPLN